MDDELKQARVRAIDERIAAMTGPKTSGSLVIIDGRAVPNMTMHEEGDMIAFTLDNRMQWAFPRELAEYVASFAANAMAIGAGFPCFSAERKVEHFATPCTMFELPCVEQDQ